MASDRRSISAADRVRALRIVADLSGGDRELARSWCQFPTLNAAIEAAIGVADRHAHEGLSEIRLIVFGYKKRSWMIAKEGGRFWLLVASKPTREPAVLRGAELRRLFDEAVALLKPLRRYVRSNNFRNPTDHRNEIRQRFPDAMRRLSEAGLQDEFLVANRAMPGVAEIAAILVSKENKNAGKPSTVRRNAYRATRNRVKDSRHQIVHY